MLENSDIVIIIPAYNPDEKMMSFINDINMAGYKNIIIVDDGSREDTKKYFKQAEKIYNCRIISHSINLGQGRAYKSAFNYYLSETDGYYEDSIGIIQCDCDGQHRIEDINRCAELLRSNPQKFILGVRDFSDKSIPFRSRFGNNCTSFVFKVFCGMDLKDTQTGLKGIPRSFIPALMETPGERFEYASSCLLETKKQGLEIIQFPIQTIYINGNETSHFNPLLDSIRIYSLILKYLMSSLSAFIIDIILYSVFLSLLRGLPIIYHVIYATYMARFVAGAYTFVVNKQLVFREKGSVLSSGIKFAILGVIQATCSAFIVQGMVFLFNWDEVLCKIIVDTVLFFIGFQIQSRWVFNNK